MFFTGEVTDTVHADCVTCEEGCQKCVSGGYRRIIFSSVICQDSLFMVTNVVLHCLMQADLSPLQVKHDCLIFLGG